MPMIANQTRQLAAIMFVDIQGYTKLMAENEQRAYSMRAKMEVALHKNVHAYKGKIIKKMGDGALCLFNSDIQAVSAAIAIQLEMRTDPAVPVRIGIHSGDVVLDKQDVYGDSVNVASRVESFSVAGGILISGKVFDEIRNQPNIKTAKLGKFNFTNVKEPVDVYAVSNEGIIVPSVKKLQGKGITHYKKRSAMARLVAIMAILVVAVSITLYKTVFVVPAGEKMKSVVVMPFKNMSENQDNNFFSDGITEDILTQISKINGLSVLSQSTTMQLKNNPKTVIELGQELNVNYVLEGSVRRAIDQIRITAQLVDAASGKNIWAETYDREYSKIFEIQSEIARYIANVLKTRLSFEEKRNINKKPTTSLSAYEHYLRGRDHYYQFSRNGNNQAIEEFKTAISLDENYALAWAGLGDAFSQKVRLGYPTNWLDSGKLASETAIELDGSSSEAYKALANYYLYNADYQSAKPLLVKAISLNPNNASAIGNLGSCYMLFGQLDEALKWEKKSAVLEPKKFIPFSMVGWIYRLLGDLDQAEQWLKKSIELRPYTDSYYNLAYTYIARGQAREARAIVSKIVALDSANIENLQIAGIIAQMLGDDEMAAGYYQKAIDLEPGAAGNPDFFGTVGLAYYMQKTGKMVDAEIILSRAMQVYPDTTIKAANKYDRFLYAGATFALGGQKEKAIYYLNMAAKANWIDHFFTEQSPWFKNIRTEPGYKTLMQQLRNKAAAYKLKADKE